MYDGREVVAAARGLSPGLSTEELEAIRDGLAVGRRPRVMFTESAGQMAGQTGQVVELTDPEISDEWVVVRFGRDELPFSPTDLAIPSRAAPARSSSPKTPPPAAQPELKIVREKTPAQVPAPRQEEDSVATQSPSTVAAKAAAGTTDEPATGEVKPARKATKAAKPKMPPSFTVTLAYADGEWTVAAMRGDRALAKPYLLKPAEALKMVGMLDVPAVHEAVEQILTTERAEVERQAERLRAELAEIEAKLADLR